MLKVLYVLNHAGKAGTERYVESLIAKLSQKDEFQKEPLIKAYFVYNEEGLLVERLKDMGIETFRISMNNPFDIKAAVRISKLCKNLNIDIIHTQFLRENYISLLSKILNPRVKVIYTNHFVLKNNVILKITNRILSLLQSQIIAVCNKGKEVMISNGIPKNKIEVIFNGVDIKYWGQDTKSTLRKEFNIDKGDFVILCCSRFAHDKGHEFLINAISELKKYTNKSFKCVLANDGPLLEERKKQVVDLGLEQDVIFTGFRQDVKNLIYASNLYINSSEHEALSFAIIEVLACGVPVIATDMAGNGDIINESTKCGVLVKYNDYQALAKVIHNIMQDQELQRNLSKYALVAVSKFFNLDKIIAKTYNLYVKSI